MYIDDLRNILKKIKKIKGVKDLYIDDFNDDVAHIFIEVEDEYKENPRKRPGLVKRIKKEWSKYLLDPEQVPENDYYSFGKKAFDWNDYYSAYEFDYLYSGVLYSEPLEKEKLDDIEYLKEKWRDIEDRIDYKNCIYQKEIAKTLKKHGYGNVKEAIQNFIKEQKSEAMSEFLIENNINNVEEAIRYFEENMGKSFEKTKKIIDNLNSKGLYIYNKAKIIKFLETYKELIKKSLENKLNNENNIELQY